VTATEGWCLAAAVLAILGAIAHLVPEPRAAQPRAWPGLAFALYGAAIACLAAALAVSAL
jgi:hypothetical protein